MEGGITLCHSKGLENALQSRLPYRLFIAMDPSQYQIKYPTCIREGRLVPQHVYVKQTHYPCEMIWFSYIKRQTMGFLRKKRKSLLTCKTNLPFFIFIYWYVLYCTLQSLLKTQFKINNVINVYYCSKNPSYWLNSTFEYFS